MKELALALMDASKAIQQAHRVARDAGREDICQALRKAGWDTADALVMLAENLSAKEAAS
jgi:O-methyltransferase involved in polyketide biosynthesis